MRWRISPPMESMDSFASGAGRASPPRRSFHEWRLHGRAAGGHVHLQRQLRLRDQSGRHGDAELSKSSAPDLGPTASQGNGLLAANGSFGDVNPAGDTLVDGQLTTVSNGSATAMGGSNANIINISNAAAIGLAGPNSRIVDQSGNDGVRNLTMNDGYVSLARPVAFDRRRSHEQRRSRPFRRWQSDGRRKHDQQWRFRGPSVRSFPSCPRSARASIPLRPAQSRFSRPSMET